MPSAIYFSLLTIFGGGVTFLIMYRIKQCFVDPASSAE